MTVVVAEPDLARIAAQPFDHARVEAAVRELLVAIGEDPSREGLRDTPSRFARAYEEQFRELRAQRRARAGDQPKDRPPHA